MEKSSDNTKIFCDGGSRGNPGPSACAFLIYHNEKIVHQQGLYLGIGTNNQAEYQAVLEALKYLGTEPCALSTINFFLDSELVVKQLKGLYKIKDARLKIKYLEIKSLLGTSYYALSTVKFHHIVREKNFLADKLVNNTLDANL